MMAQTENPSLARALEEKALYLHIGQPKTGTTTIQKALSESAALPDSCNYLVAGRTRNGRIEDRHRELWAALMCALGRTPPKVVRYTRDKTYWRHLVDSARAEIAASPLNKHIVSFEGLAGLASINGATDLLVELRKRLWPVRVIPLYYVRQPRSFLVSKYKSEVRSKSNVPRFLDWVIQTPRHHLDQNAPLRLYGAVFGRRRLILRSYESTGVSGLLDDFYAAIDGRSQSGQRANEPDSAARRNTSIEDRDVERTRVRQVNKTDGEQRRALLVGSPGFLETNVDPFCEALRRANRGNDKVFRGRLQQQIEPLTLAWAMEVERQLNYGSWDDQTVVDDGEEAHG